MKLDNMIYVFLLVLLFSSASSSITSSILSNKYVNAQCNYTIVATRVSTATTISSISIVFVSSASLTGVTSCTIGGASGSCPTATSNNMSWTSSSMGTCNLSTSCTISVYNITNPSTSVSNAFTVYFYYTNGASQNMSGGGISPGNPSISFQFLNYTNTVGMVSISLNTTQPIPSGTSYIVLTYPTFWKQNANNSTLNKGFTAKAGTVITGVTVTKISMPSAITLSSTLNTLTTTGFSVLITSTSIVSAPATFSFYISGVNMPPTESTVYSSDSIQVGLGDGSNYYDLATNYLFSSTPVQTLTSTFSALTNSTINSISNSNINIMITSVLDNQIATNQDYLYITYPSSSYQTNFSSVSVQSTSYSGIQGVLNTTNSTGNVYQISPNGQTYLSETIPPNDALNITLPGTLAMPSSILPIAFTVSVIRGSPTSFSNRIFTTTLYLCASPMTLTNASILATPATYSKQANYTISIITDVSISSSGGFVIIFPLGCIFTTSTVTVLNPPTNSVSNPTYASSSTGISISNIFTGTFAAGSNITLFITNVTNPTNPLLLTNFNISTYDNMTNNQTLIQTNASISYPYIPNILSVSLTISNLTVGATSTYTFSYSTGMILSVSSSIIVAIPTTSLTYVSIVSVTIGAITNLITSYSSPNLTIYLSNYGTDVPAATAVVIVLNIINPLMTGSTGSFAVYEQASNGVQVENCTNITGTITTAAQFSQFSINSVLNSKTGNVNNYRLTFTPSVFQPQNSVLTLTLPSEMSLAANISVSCSVVCTSTFTTTSVITNFTGGSISTSSSIIVTYSNIINPRSLAPSSDFTATTSYNSNSINTNTVTSLSMSTPNTMVISYQYSAQNYLASTAYVGIVVNSTFNTLANTDCLVFTVDGQFYTRNLTAAASSSCSESSFSCSDYVSGGTLICTKNSSPFPSVPFTVSILGYSTSFNQTPNGYVKLTSMDANSYSIDISNQLAFVLTCNATPFCQTCSLTNISSCTSCYNNTNITVNVYYYSAGNTCTNNCSSLNQYYYGSTNLCTQCISPCLTCTSSTSCNSCVTNYYLYSNLSCNLGCQTNLNYFTSSQTVGSITYNYCYQCSTTCLTCSNTASFCLTCNNTGGTSLMPQNGTCVSSCSVGYFNNSNVCTSCYTTCGSCTGSSATSCITCLNTSYFLTPSNSCVTTCPSTYVTNYTSFKCYCDPNCTQCSGQSNNCTNCLSGYLIVNQVCMLLSSCPTGNYQSGITCVACSVGCNACTSATGCTTCSNNYYNYNSQCYTVCSSAAPGLVGNNAGLCVACATGCNYCNSSVLTQCFSCLTNYIYNSTSNTCTLNSSTINSNTTSCSIGYYLDGSICLPDQSTNGKIIVAIVSTISVGFIAFAVISKFLGKQISLAYSVMPVQASVQVISIILLVGFVGSMGGSRRLLATNYTFNGQILQLACLGVNYLLNLTHLWIYFKYIASDQLFGKNKKTKQNKIFNGILLFIATLTNYRFYQIVFSSLCDIKLFKSKLTKIQKLYPLYALNAINLVSSLVALIGAALICSNSNIYQSQLYAGIMVIIIILTTIIFTLLGFIKDQKFFDTDDKYQEESEKEHNQTIEQLGGQETLKQKKSAKLESQTQIFEFEDKLKDGDQPLYKKNIKDPLYNRTKSIVHESSAINSQTNESINQSHTNLVGDYKRDLQYDSEMDIRLNQRSSKMKNKKRLSKIPIREKSKASEMLEIIQNKNDNEQEQKIDSIIDDLESNNQKPKNLVKTIEDNQSDIVKQEQKIQIQQPPQKKNLVMTSNKNDLQGYSQKKSPVSSKEDSTLIIKIKQRDRMKVRNSEALLKKTNLLHEDDTSQQSKQKEESIDMEFIDKFYHNNPDSALENFSEPEVQYNEISPSQFNIENQRFDMHSSLEYESSINFNKKNSEDYSRNLKQFSQLRKNYD